MSAYAPTSAADVWGTIALLVATLGLGFLISRVRPFWLARLAAWGLVVVAVVAVERLNAGEPAGFRMLAIIGVLLYAMKAVVAVEVRSQGAPGLPFDRWLGFAALWPGMRPGPFLRSSGRALPGSGALLRGGLVRMATGFVLIWLARGSWVAMHSRLLATVLLLPGLSLSLHFGVFDLLAGFWRWWGVACERLFRSPLQSTSLTEFWGRRWNLAFSEMTALAIYQPLARRWGRRPALVTSFLGSGLLHELAISVPVRAGYGLPMLYFLLHGTLVMLERRLARSGHPMDGAPWVGRIWTFSWLIVPLPILFHPPFLAGVAWPIIGIDPKS